MKKLILVIVVTLLLISGCRASESSASGEDITLRFVPKISMFEEGVVHFEIGIVNDGSKDFTGLEDANIRVVITDEAGKLRNQMRIVDIHIIRAGESVYPLTYEAVYDPGKYTASLTGENIPSLTMAFEIREEDGVRLLAAPPNFIDPYTEFTINAPDI